MEESDICPPWALTPPPPPPYQGAQILANFFLKLHLTMMYHCAKYEVKVHDGVGQQDSRYPLANTCQLAYLRMCFCAGMLCMHTYVAYVRGRPEDHIINQAANVYIPSAEHVTTNCVTTQPATLSSGHCSAW
jgi:hypothetical protein